MAMLNDRRMTAEWELMTYASELPGRWNDVQRTDNRRPGRIADVLSPREISVVALIGHGQSNKEIARQLEIAPETVKTHVKNIFVKLGVERRAQAVLRAYALGLIGEGSSAAAGHAAI